MGRTLIPQRRRFPPEVMRLALWLCFRFTLCIRDVEEMRAHPGIEAGRETVRCWVNTLGRRMAAGLRRRAMPPAGRWHLGEMVVKIVGKRMFLWRACDDQGEAFDMLAQKRRNKAAALKLLRRLVKNHPRR